MGGRGRMPSIRTIRARFHVGSHANWTAAPPEPTSNFGAASDFQLSLPTGVPARVTAGDPAGEVSLEGQEHAGVAGGSVVTTAGWAPGVTGFDIDVTAGVSQITVTARSG